MTRGKGGDEGAKSEDFDSGVQAAAKASLESAVGRLEREAGATSSEGVPAATRRRLEGLAEKVNLANDFSGLERDLKAEIEFVQRRRGEVASAKAEALYQERLRPYSEDFRHRHHDGQRELQIKLHQASGESAPLTPCQMAILEDLRGGQGAEAVQAWSAPMVPEGVSPGWSGTWLSSAPSTRRPPRSSRTGSPSLEACPKAWSGPRSWTGCCSISPPQ